MKQWSMAQIMKGLMDLVTDINYLGETGNVNGKSGGIQLGTENGYFYKGIPPFNHNLDYGEMLLSDNGDADPNQGNESKGDVHLWNTQGDLRLA